MPDKKENFELLEKKIQELSQKKQEIVELTIEIATGTGKELLNLEERFRLLYFIEEQVTTVDENLFYELLAIVSVL